MICINKQGNPQRGCQIKNIQYNLKSSQCLIGGVLPDTMNLPKPKPLSMETNTGTAATLVVSSNGRKIRHTQRFLDEMKEVIEKKIDAAREDLNLHLRKGDPSLDEKRGDFYESAQGSSDRMISDEICRRAQDTINKCNDALRRINDKTYGVDPMSGELIPEGRMRACPLTTQDCRNGMKARG